MQFNSITKLQQKNFLYKYLPTDGGSSRRWEKDYGKSDLRPDDLEHIPLNHLIDINDFIKFVLTDPANLFNDNCHVNLKNYPGSRKVNLCDELGGE